MGERDVEVVQMLLANLKTVKLEKLGLGSTGMDDKSLRGLVEVLPSFRSLKVLGLSGNRLTSEGVEFLLTRLQKLREEGACLSLHTLILHDNSISDAEVSKLQSLSPKGMIVQLKSDR
mmetsp:Transcript_33177/g.104924  ORF Transcript_33177/g.104924 Transcript_33177/m.104924 type:complete len:118 (-) Transcript_33177:255-608(-)